MKPDQAITWPGGHLILIRSSGTALKASHNSPSQWTFQWSPQCPCKVLSLHRVTMATLWTGLMTMTSPYLSIPGKWSLMVTHHGRTSFHLGSEVFISNQTNYVGIWLLRMGSVTCNICDRSFKTELTYSRHKKYQHTEKKFPCNICGKQFTQASNLTTHIIGVHNDNKVNHKCDQCGREYTSKVAVNSHIKSAHENKKYPCILCDYQAKRRDHLTQHEQSVYEGVKYPCQQCEHKATTQGSLTKHIQSTHVGKKYQCKVCDKKYTDTSALLRHKKSGHLNRL